MVNAYPMDLYICTPLSAVWFVELLMNLPCFPGTVPGPYGLTMFACSI